jgi:hypothetical protein
VRTGNEGGDTNRAGRRRKNEKGLGKLKGLLSSYLLFAELLGGFLLRFQGLFVGVAVDAETENPGNVFFQRASNFHFRVGQEEEVSEGGAKISAVNV